MKVEGTKGPREVEKAPAVERAGGDQVPSDRVNLEQARKVAELVQVAQSKAGGARTARLAQIETAIRNGSYQPSPGQIAEQILSAAELDARLQAMLGR